jgi:hypothetical protein
MRVIIRRIKISIIADPRRQFHSHVFLRVKNFSAQPSVNAQRRDIRREKMLKNLARLSPCRAAERQK